MQTEREAREALHYAPPGTIGDLEQLAGIGREPNAEHPSLLFWRDVVAKVGNDADPKTVFDEGARRLRLRVSPGAGQRGLRDRLASIPAGRMNAAPRQTAAAQLADFLGLSIEVILPGNARLVLKSFSTHAEGAHVNVTARYLRFTPRLDAPEAIKHYELREIPADGAPS